MSVRLRVGLLGVSIQINFVSPGFMSSEISSSIEGEKVTWTPCALKGNVSIQLSYWLGKVDLQRHLREVSMSPTVYIRNRNYVGTLRQGLENCSCGRTTRGKGKRVLCIL
jgi:hypothetical protein